MRNGQILATGLIGILLGAGGFWLVGGHRHRSSLPQGIINPTNAPVVVRGGSVEVRALSWTVISSTAPEVLKATNTNNTILGLDGVDSSGDDSPAGAYQTGLNQNWRITLTFRKPDGSEDTTKTLQICTSYDKTANACQYGGSTTFSSNTLYLVSDGTGFFTSVGSLDGYDRRRYDLNANSCGTSGSARDTVCNHAFGVKVDGISGLAKFKCVAGECDIGVGTQP
jgi:hypothetical protein